MSMMSGFLIHAGVVFSCFLLLFFRKHHGGVSMYFYVFLCSIFSLEDIWRMFLSLILLYALFVFPSWSSGKYGGLPVKRILSEWRKINKSKLDLSQPFNGTNEEVCSLFMLPMITYVMMIYIVWC
jgi:hypothetical protein